jgi:hypothetical protein
VHFFNYRIGLFAMRQDASSSVSFREVLGGDVTYVMFNRGPEGNEIILLSSGVEYGFSFLPAQGSAPV